MSTNSETNQLNLGGQAFLGLIASLCVNTVVHPLGTIKNRLMAGGVLSLPYREVIRKSLRTSGLAMTALREIPFTGAVFYVSPMLQEKLQNATETKVGTFASKEIIIQAAAGTVAGSVAGFATAPIDLIKTRVQTSHQTISILSAFQSVIAKDGWRGLAKGSITRVMYIGAAGAVMNIVNNAAPQYFPNILKNTKPEE